MTKQQAEKLMEINPDLELRKSYSGRGMYGRTTYAVVYDHQREVYENIADAIREAFHEEDFDGLNDMLELMMNLKWDNMGLGFVVY